MSQEEKAELIDIVDRNDKVIGTAPREGIHKTSLFHRAVHIFLIDHNGNIWLEKRAKNVDTFPEYYSSSAAGHLQKGETYLDGANREALEELGIPNLILKQKNKLAASKKTSNEFVGFFVAESELKPKAHRLTEKLEVFSIQEIDRKIYNGDRFVPIFLMLFEWYKSNISNIK